MRSPERRIGEGRPLKEWLKALLVQERRRSQRHTAPQLVAHCWDGAAPSPHAIRDISATGLYLLTEQRWYPRTLVMLSLLRTDCPIDGPESALMVNTKVVRSGTDGIGVEFMPSHTPRSQASKDLAANGADRKTFDRFLKRVRTDQGQALVEYILILPLVFLLIVNMVNFGGFFYAWIAVANAARAGADYAVMGGASVGLPAQTTVTQIRTLITNDMAALPNAASLVVNICQSTNGTVATLSGSCSAVPADPEASSYSLMSIDVTYTYQPFIPVFQFPNLHVYATIPATSIHRRTVMRVIQ